LASAAATAMPIASAGLGERRDQHEQRYDSQVLEQQHRDHLAAVRAVELAALGEHFRHDRGRRHGDDAAERDPDLPRRAQRERERHREAEAGADLREAQAEHQLAHRLELGEAELQADREHQEHHAQFSEVLGLGAVAHRAQGVRAERDASREIADHRRQLQGAAHGDRQHARGEQHEHGQQRQVRSVHGLYSPPMIKAAQKPRVQSKTALEIAKRVLLIEADAVRGLIERIDQSFPDAVELIAARKGRVVVSGMGKSGHIARKIASTLASTGTPAYFVHPAEASHGDLGMVEAGDVFIAISYSGASEELLQIVPLVKRRGAKLIALTGKRDSALAPE
jgi:hypothetical protein